MKHLTEPAAIAHGSIQLPYWDETYVYRVYCRCGRLLYAGMTADLPGRFVGHQRESSWFWKAARVEWDLYPSREAAARAERRTIREQAPLYNSHHARYVPRRTPLPWPRFLTDQDQYQRAICAHHGESFLAWLFVVESWGRPA